MRRSVCGLIMLEQRGRSGPIILTLGLLIAVLAPGLTHRGELGLVVDLLNEADDSGIALGLGQWVESGYACLIAIAALMVARCAGRGHFPWLLGLLGGVYVVFQGWWLSGRGQMAYLMLLKDQPDSAVQAAASYQLMAVFTLGIVCVLVEGPKARFGRMIGWLIWPPLAYIVLMWLNLNLLASDWPLSPWVAVAYWLISLMVLKTRAPKKMRRRPIFRLRVNQTAPHLPA